jgi:hypothetical protein
VDSKALVAAFHKAAPKLGRTARPEGRLISIGRRPTISLAEDWQAATRILAELTFGKNRTS